MTDKICITDLMIMRPSEIKKASRKLGFHETNDLVSELDNEASNMIKQNGKTSKQLLDMGILPGDSINSEFYNPNYVYNWTSTINQLIEIRKILARSQINKVNLGI